jgi:V8-like Glu-specific endopeptidase
MGTDQGGGTIIKITRGGKTKVGIQMCLHQMNRTLEKTQNKEVHWKLIRDLDSASEFNVQTFSQYGDVFQNGEYVFMPIRSDIRCHPRDFVQPTKLGLHDGTTSLVINGIWFEQRTQTFESKTGVAHYWEPTDELEWSHECDTEAGASGHGMYAYDHTTRTWKLVGCNRGKRGSHNRGLGTWARLNDPNCPLPPLA